MAAIVNDRDVLLQATVPRYAAATDRTLVLSSSAPVFKVAANGVGSPASIVFTPALINMAGVVSYTTTGGLALTFSGNVATLAFSGMSAASGTVTASITVDSVIYTSVQTIAKVSDGIIGDSARRAYSKTSLTSLGSTPTTLTTAGSTSFPPDGSWGAGTVWSSSPQTLVAGESLYQSDGVFSPVAGSITWSVPYLSSLKVGSLSAITIDAGNIRAGDFYGTTMHGGTGYPTSAYGWPSNGGGGFHLSATGLLLGNANTGQYVEISAAGNLYAPGLSIANGVATYSGSFSVGSLQTVSAIIGVLRTASSGARQEIRDNVIKMYDSSNVKRMQIGDQSL